MYNFLDIESAWYLLRRSHWNRAHKVISKMLWCNDHSIVSTDHKQDWRMFVWNFALNEETSLNRKLASSLHRRRWNAFFFFNFLLYPVKTKCFYVLCKWFLHVVWQFIFAIFLIKGKTPRRGNKQKPTAKQNLEGWHFIWKNIWIQNLPEDVDRFFFFLTENQMSRGGQSRNGNKWSSSVIKLLFLAPFVFKSSGLAFYFIFFLRNI